MDDDGGDGSSYSIIGYDGESGKDDNKVDLS